MKGIWKKKNLDVKTTTDFQLRWHLYSCCITSPTSAPLSASRSLAAFSHAAYDDEFLNCWYASMRLLVLNWNINILNEEKSDVTTKVLSETISQQNRILLKEEGNTLFSKRTQKEVLQADNMRFQKGALKNCKIIAVKNPTHNKKRAK